MTVAYVDCSAGAAGDMLLGAFVDAGLPVGTLEAAVSALGLGAEVRVSATQVSRGGLRACHIEVRTADDAPRRAVPAVLELIDRAALSPSVRTASRAAIERLADVEGRLHGVAPERVHLHELGGADTVVDVVGFHVAWEALGIEGMTVSPINVGSGTIRMAHGTLGVPGPATAELLKGAPVHGGDTKGEAVTPTAALLLTGPGTAFGPMPAMRLRAIGYGAGTRDTSAPNVVRCVLGESEHRVADGWRTETVTLLETNLDDLNPQVYEHVVARLFAAGALDAYLVPIIAKHGRPGVMVGVIAPVERADALTAVLFAETPTLGVRRAHTQRAALARRIEERATTLGTVRVKIATLPDGVERAAPEYADLARIADERRMPLIDVVRHVTRDLGG